MADKPIIHPLVEEPAKLYVTNRAEFNKLYKESPVTGAMLDEMFLESESRPDIAERIALKVLGHIPSRTKKGYDGETTDGRAVEAKVRNAVTREDGTLPQGLTQITINDVSKTIIERYDIDNPLFVFPYFIDGHLAASFDVEYANIRHHYLNCLSNHTKGRCSFKLYASEWIKDSNVSFVHGDQNVVNKLPKMLASKAVDSPSTNYYNSSHNWFNSYFSNPVGMTYNKDTNTWSMSY